MSFMTHHPHQDCPDCPPPPGMTEDQLDYFSDQSRRAVRKAIRVYVRSAVVGFVVLVAGVGYALFTQSNEQDATQRAIIHSGQAVAVTSCNRDFEFTKRIRGLLERLRNANTQAFRQGKIDPTRYYQAQAFYSKEINRLTLPDCRVIEDSMEPDPDRPVEVPTPLYPHR